MQEQDDNQLGNIILEQVFELWVNPELKRRSMELSRDEITRVVVEMPATDEGPKILLNQDAHMAITGNVTRDVEAGEAVYLHDLSVIEDVRPTELDPNSGWICYVRLGSQQMVTFDLRPNRGRATALLQKAREFLKAAKSIADTSPDVAVDNAHSAAELTVQAQMLLMRNATTNHGARRKWFSGWTQLENSPPHHADMLLDLANRRSQARYGPERLALKPGRLIKILDTVQEMIDTTAERIG